MDPPKVLIEQSFLDAVHDSGHAQHDLAAAEYVRLVDRFQREELLLYAVSTHLYRYPGMVGPLRQIGLVRRGVFAPLDYLWVGFQHRRVARRAAAVHELDLDVALTLTMAQRHKITQVATLDPRFEAFELSLLPERADEPADDAGDDADAPAADAPHS
jgi:predicted nucleic acid-binding protein